ncbi:E3 ubiquitin-protein ligase UPL3-like isoform X2 [Arachis ipaensis]|uniref:E3 ubiquitin-protein ligase UPL3-like isoform X2 n=1 Tax=Arachis ipaensis TaxID=130454 RepID=UPI000A2B8F43|nr:E3 ubiquitin-protein ligase UPL3-like isoform X2 [Arachis ipaensis]
MKFIFNSRFQISMAFDISSLQIFTPQELDYLLCGRREMWKADTLVDHIKFDHGYTAKSPAIVNVQFLSCVRKKVIGKLSFCQLQPMLRLMGMGLQN